VSNYGTVRLSAANPTEQGTDAVLDSYRVMIVGEQEIGELGERIDR
jgi:hypothetical protein